MDGPTVHELTADEQAEQAILEQKARALARVLDRELNGNGPRHRGFALLLFDFGTPPQPATYISNGDRADMIHAIEEWLERARRRS